MKGKIARIAALTLALLLVLGYWLLPVREERSIPSGGGHGKYALADGESASWPWTPEMDGSSELSLELRSLKKAAGMTLNAVLTEENGTEAARMIQAIDDIGDEDGLALKGNFRKGIRYTLTVSASGEGTITLRGEEDEDGYFVPSLGETGIVTSRNPVLLYFAVGMLLLFLMPVTGPDVARTPRTKRKRTLSDILPWAAFVIIMTTGLLVALKKPADYTNPNWGTWDEDTHSYWVQSMALISWGGLRACLNSVITWHPGYLPLGIGYNVGEILNQAGVNNPDLPYRCAVISSTLCYAFMTALAVKHTPKFKMTFLVAGTIPLMIFQATCMTYDTVVTGAVLLGTALVLETLSQPGRMSSLRAITLVALLSMGTVAKPAYGLAMLSLMLIPAAKFSGKGEKWGFRALVMLAMVWCFLAMAMPGAYEDVLGGDARFSDTNSGAQLQGMLADPMGSGLKPVRYFFEHLRFLTCEWLDFWAYASYGFPHLGEMYAVLLLLVAPLCVPDGEPEVPRDLLKPSRRLTFGIIACLAELALIYAQYIASSPVGGAITGMQPRYFMPLWAPTLMLLMLPRYAREKAQPVGNILTVVTLVLCSGVNIENAIIHLRAFGAL